MEVHCKFFSVITLTVCWFRTRLPKIDTYIHTYIHVYFERGRCNNWLPDCTMSQGTLPQYEHNCKRHVPPACTHDCTKPLYTHNRRSTRVSVISFTPSTLGLPCLAPHQYNKLSFSLSFSPVSKDSFAQRNYVDIYVPNFTKIFF